MIRAGALERIEARVSAIPPLVALGWTIAVAAATSARFFSVRSAGSGSTLTLGDALKLGMRLDRNLAWVGAAAVALSTSALLIIVVAFMLPSRWGRRCRFGWLTVTALIAASCWYVAKASPGVATWLMTLGTLSGGAAELMSARNGRQS